MWFVKYFDVLLAMSSSSRHFSPVIIHRRFVIKHVKFFKRIFFEGYRNVQADKVKINFPFDVVF